MSNAYVCPVCGGVGKVAVNGWWPCISCNGTGWLAYGTTSTANVMGKEKDPAAVALGRKGGQVKSERKRQAALEREAKKKTRREAEKKEE